MYEYLCHNCGKRFEQIQKFSDAPLTVHPECDSGPVERLISVPTFQFKGTGWYATDYAKSSGGGNGASKADSKSPPETKSDSSKGDSAKSESSKTESSKKSEPASSTSSAATPAPTVKQS
jgi:putative FmdB family regulatory protein